MTAKTVAQTLAQKIIARAAGREAVGRGEIVTARVDLAMIHDSGGPRRVAPILERLGVGLWDASRVVLIVDHYVPAEDEESRRIVGQAQAFAARHALGGFYDGEGICHVVLPERGHLRPGLFAVGGDSHSPTGGAYQAVEYAGEAIGALPMQERMTLSNMTAELGGQTGLIAPDAVTVDYLRAAGADPSDWRQWFSDPDAPLLAHHRFAAEELQPQVAAPHSPALSAAVGEYQGRPIDVAYIGACTGAKLVDLRMAAEVLRGQRVAEGVSLFVAPASRRDQEAAAADGTLQVLLDAGGRLLPNACGICAGYGGARLGEDVTCISTTARNFRGRMGAASSQVFLASPYTVAASALGGRITDPRPHLTGRAGA